jgi:hypothetical protein
MTHPVEGKPLSTCLYLACENHAHPIRAEDESGQHHHDLPQIRFDWLRRDHWLPYIDRFPDTLTADYDHLTYFQRATWKFLVEHRDCGTPHIISEHGERFTIEAPSITALMSETGSYAPPPPSAETSDEPGSWKMVLWNGACSDLMERTFPSVNAWEAWLTKEHPNIFRHWIDEEHFKQHGTGNYWSALTLAPAQDGAVS